MRYAPGKHPDDRDKKRKAKICAAFTSGLSVGEIAAQEHVSIAVITGIVSRAGLSRGDKPSPPRRFSWDLTPEL